MASGAPPRQPMPGRESKCSPGRPAPLHGALAAGCWSGAGAVNGAPTPPWPMGTWPPHPRAD
eukprot:4130785-Lingulodinium_polyedra.AAC.1